MADKITIQPPNASAFEADDTAENRKLAADKGFKIEEGFVRNVGEFARGMEETIGRHDITNYNPLLKPEQYLLKGIANIAGAKPTDELPKAPPSGKVTFKTPDGQSFQADDTPENRNLAKERGFALESEAEKAKALPENQGYRGAAKAYLENVGNEYGFGIPKLMMNEKERTDFNAASENSPTAATLGGVAGISANMATPVLNLAGPIGKAEKVATGALSKLGITEAAATATGEIVENSLLQKMALGAAKGASAGVVYSAPHAAGELAFGDPKLAAEGLALGGLGGGVLGGALPVLGTVPELLKRASRETGMNAEDRAFKMIGGTKAIAKKMGDEKKDSVMRTLLDAGINEPGMGKDRIVQNLERIKLTSGEEIGNVGKLVDMVAKSNPELSQEGFRLGNVVNQIDEKIMPEVEGSFSRSNASRNNHLTTIMQDMVEFGHGKQALQGAETLDDVKRLLQNAPPLSFEQSAQIKKEVGKLAALGKRYDLLTDNELVARKVYDIVSDELEDGVERIATKMGDPDLLARYVGAKKTYGAVKLIKDNDIVENMMATAKGNRMFGLTDNIAGVGAVHAAISGHPAALLLPVAKKALESTQAQSALVSFLDYAGMNLRTTAAETIAGRFAAVDKFAKLAVEGTAKGVRLQDSNEQPMAKAVGSSATDPHTAYADFSKQITPLATDPEKMKAALAPFVRSMGESDPDAAFHFAQHQTALINYLYAEMPKAPTNNALFYNPEYKPTLAELTAFNQKVAIANDPFYVVRKIEDGTLSKTQLAAIQTLYPEINKLITKRITDMGYEKQLATNQANLPYNVRVRMSRLTGALGDPSMDPRKASAMQAMYAKKKAGNAANPKGEFTNQLPTETQKLEMK